MENRVILITGANKGLGLETARQLGKAGHTVVMTGRDAQKIEQAAAQLVSEGINAHAVVMDVTQAASIEKAAEKVAEQFGKIDTLINNAGIGQDPHGQPLSSVSVNIWRSTFETNVFGVVAVTQAFLPLLKKSEAGRIVNVGSLLGSLAAHSDPNSPIYHFKMMSYDCSKSALNQLTVHLAYELSGTGIKVNTAHPGWVKTDLGGEGAPMEIVDGAKTSVYLATLPNDGPTGAFIHMQERLPW